MKMTNENHQSIKAQKIDSTKNKQSEPTNKEKV